MNVTIIRQYQLSLSCTSRPFTAIHAGVYGRMLLNDRLNRIELLDSQLNLLDYTGPKVDEGKCIFSINCTTVARGMRQSLF